MQLKKARIAALCGVSRPTVGEAVKRGTLREVDGRIDLSDAMNLAYLTKHNAAAAAEYQRTGTISGVASPKESPEKPSKPATASTMKKKLDEIRAEETPDIDAEFDPMAGLSLSGVKRRGSAPSDDGPSLDGLTDAEVAETLRKPLYDARKAKMESEIKAVSLDTLHRSLGEREEFDNLIQCLWQAMQMNYLDVVPKQSALICKRLGCVGKELEVIEVLEADVKKRQDNVARVVGDMLTMRLSNLVKVEGEEE